MIFGMTEPIFRLKQNHWQRFRIRCRRSGSSGYRSAANASTTFSKVSGCLQGSNSCSPANTARIYSLTSDMCSAHQCTGIHFVFMPFHLHNAGRKNEYWWSNISVNVQTREVSFSVVQVTNDCYISKQRGTCMFSERAAERQNGKWN